jgi:hypothetical protein
MSITQNLTQIKVLSPAANLNQFAHSIRGTPEGVPVMKSLRLTAVTIVLSLGMSVPGGAQTIPGYTLQEIVLVPVTGASMSSLQAQSFGDRHRDGAGFWFHVSKR